MAFVRITDVDCFDKMVQLEGEQWRTEETEWLRGGPYRGENTFHRVELYWVAFNEIGDDCWFDSNKTIIFGGGGWNRYYVDRDGTVRFSRRHSCEPLITKAITLGFKVNRV